MSLKTYGKEILSTSWTLDTTLVTITFGLSYSLGLCLQPIIHQDCILSDALPLLKQQYDLKKEGKYLMHKHLTTQHAINLHKCNVFDMLLRYLVVTLKVEPMRTNN